MRQDALGLADLGDDIAQLVQYRAVAAQVTAPWLRDRSPVLRLATNGAQRTAPDQTSCLPTMSAFVRITDSWQTSGQVRFVPILLLKSFWGDEQKFLEPLMRFTSGDVRDHIVSSKIDHGPP